jgi:hypothetical protein
MMRGKIAQVLEELPLADASEQQRREIQRLLARQEKLEGNLAAEEQAHARAALAERART